LIKKLTALAAAAALSFAMTAPQGYVEELKNYLLSKKSFAINGKFYQYDFEHDGKIQRNDWLYIDTASNLPFRLMGKTPTATDPFGWKMLDKIPSDLNLNSPSGYFIKIDFPKDKELYGTYAFSWLYLYRQTNDVYKLMGAKPDHQFDYLDINGDNSPDPLQGLNPDIAQNSVIFNQNGGENAPDANLQSCQDSNTINYGGVYYSYSTKAQYSGKIKYNCDEASQYSYELLTDSITITDIKKSENYHGKIDGTPFNGVSEYDYKAGKIHIAGTYEGKSVDCYEYYVPKVPATFTKNQNSELEELLDEWGTGGPCSPDFIKSTCPGFYYEDVEGCSEDGMAQEDILDKAKDIDAYEIRKFNIFDSTGVKNYIKIESHYILKR